MLPIGAAIPKFSLAASNGESVSNASLKGQPYVLYFYPKDDTPGCTKEACAFRDALPDYSGIGVKVFGVSADDVGKHAKFVGKYSLNFPLLADPDHAFIEACGMWVEKSMYGKKYLGIHRGTYFVDGKGKVAMAWDKVKPESHSAEVLAWIRAQA
jgi:thioredoxin-dependent peroxiredoxin